MLLNLILQVVMCAAFYPHYFLRNEIDKDNVERMIALKDPSNTVMINGFPQNEGVIYAQQIRQMFATCSQNIDLSFEETKAYLTFLDDVHPLESANKLMTHFRGQKLADEEIPSSVPKDASIKTAVYVAVAMRNQRTVPKEIPKYNSDTAKSKLYRINQ